MNSWRYVLHSLAYHWRIQAAVAVGVLVGAAVLTGALVVGDSVRGSLRQITLQRLGYIDTVLLADHFFDQELATRWASEPGFGKAFDRVVPALLFADASAAHQTAEGARRATGIQVVGAEGDFWQLAAFGPRPAAPPRGRQVILNRPLAEQLGVEVGQMIVLRLARPSAIATDSPLADRRELTENVAELEVSEILPAEGLGRFSLQPNQQLPFTAFVSLSLLQDALDESHSVNALLLANAEAETPPSAEALAAARAALRPSLSEAGLSLQHVRATYEEPATDEQQVSYEYYSLSTDRMLFSPEAERALRTALAAWDPQPVLTYLANSLQRVHDGGEPVDELAEVPYSTVTAVDSTVQLGPLLDEAGQVVGPLAADEIVLNRWTADALQAQIGDAIRLEYFQPETVDGQPLATSRIFTLRAIVPLVEPQTPYRRNQPARYDRPLTRANDPHLTPEVPGVTDQETISNWDPPFPFDYGKIQQRDEDYWDQYRTTPKAFLRYATGKLLWGSRFGQVTSFRIPITRGDPAEQRARILERIEAAIAADLEAFGFALLPVKQEGLQASSGTTPFSWLFLGFSFFLIAAAVMLVGLMFRLGVERRASEAGLLLATGMRRQQVTRLYLREGLLVAVVSSLLGVPLGVLYGWLMLAALKTYWLAAIVTPFLSLHVSAASLGIGALTGLVVVAVTIHGTLRGMRNVPATRLLAGQSSVVTSLSPPATNRWHYVPHFLWLIAAVLAAAALQLGGEMQALAFFGCGAAVLVALLIMTRRRLRDVGRQASQSGFGTGGLVMRNLARHPGRSTLTIGLMAAACFLIVAISAFRLAPTVEGTGGFTLLAESNQPLFEDLNDPAVRRDWFGSRAAQLDAVTVIPLRRKRGDDASCRNLYRVQRPQLLGVTPAMIQWFDPPEGPSFGWADSSAVQEPAQSNPWHLLMQPADGTTVPIPVVLDKNTAMYSLHLYGGVGQEFTIDYGLEEPVRFRIVGLLANSVLQGSLLVGEENLLHRFPRLGGYQFFLIDTPANQQDRVAALLEDTFSDQGFDARSTYLVLQNLLAVQNTYLSTFQSLGGLGLMLGTVGLVAVQLRNVWERRSELALLQAAGYRRRRLGRLILYEHLALLIGGLGLGALAALLTVLPHVLAGGASIPLGMLIATFLVILLIGLITGLSAVYNVTRAPLLQTLRSE